MKKTTIENCYKRVDEIIMADIQTLAEDTENEIKTKSLLCSDHPYQALKIIASNMADIELNLESINQVMRIM